MVVKDLGLLLELSLFVVELGDNIRTGKLLMMFYCRAGFGEALPVRLSLHHCADETL